MTPAATSALVGEPLAITVVVSNEGLTNFVPDATVETWSSNGNVPVAAPYDFAIFQDLPGGPSAANAPNHTFVPISATSAHGKP